MTAPETPPGEGHDAAGGRSGGAGLISLGIATFSLFVAGISAFFSYRTRVESMHHVIVEDLYETFEEWNAHALQDPFLLHLLAPPESYAEVSDVVEEGVAALDDARALELLLAERAMADVVFDAYDELLVDLERARASGDEFLVDAVGAAMEEFEGRVLRNPRLLHLWRELDHGRRSQVLDRYAERVAPGAGDTPADEIGPIQRARLRGR